MSSELITNFLIAAEIMYPTRGLARSNAWQETIGREASLDKPLTRHNSVASERTTSGDLIPDPHPSPEEEVQNRFNREQMRKIAQESNLGSKQRAVFDLLMQDFKPDEITRMLDFKHRQQVYSTIYQIRRKMKAHPDYDPDCAVVFGTRKTPSIVTQKEAKKRWNALKLLVILRDGKISEEDIYPIVTEKPITELRRIRRHAAASAG